MSPSRPDPERDSLAFTTDQVIRLTGATRRKLDYWIATGLIKPEMEVGRGRGRVRLFSFLNLLEVRIAVWLRGRISLQLIRKIVHRLRRRGLNRPLTKVVFGVVELTLTGGGSRDEVVMQMPDGRWEATIKPGQLIMELTVPIQRFSDSLDAAIAKDRARGKKVGHIEKRRGVLGATPVIAGTRVPTKAIRRLHNAGYSDRDILASYPGIKRADIDAALREEGRSRRAASSGS
jgi:uncharacterized protein (DUF433 family)